MKNHREILEDRLEDNSSKLDSTSSYIEELKRTTSQLGTDPTIFAEDLMEAEHNAHYYQAEIDRLKKEIAASPATTPGSSSKPGNVSRPGLLALALSPIGFLLGALLGSKLKTRRSDKDN